MNRVPLRLVVVGCGRVFERFYLPALLRSPDWILAGAVDRDADRRGWLGAQMARLEIAPSLADLPEGLEPDAVLISSPPETHCAVATEALRRGAHALIEKPMTVATSEAMSLLGLARNTKRRILVGFNRRFRPSYATLRFRLRGISPSRIKGISFELRTDPSGWGHVSRPGDVLDDLASHELDLVPWVMGGRVAEVRATLTAAHSTEATTDIELRMDDGIIARCKATHGPGSAEWLELRLEDQTILATLGGMTSTRRAPASLPRRYLTARTALLSVFRRVTGTPAFTAETFTRQLAAWAGVLRGGAIGSCADGDDGARCVALVEACRRSLAAEGAWVAPEPL